MPVHDTTVTAVQWIESFTPKSHKVGVTNACFLLATGASNGAAAIWHVTQGPMSWGLELCKCLTIGSHPIKGLIPNATATHVSSSAAALGPVTGLASSQASDGLFLAVVSGDSPVQIWSGLHEGEAVESSWRHAQCISAPQGITQLCAAFGVIPGNPDWCVSCPCYPCLQGSFIA
jgi:hypothetical protein